MYDNIQERMNELAEKLEGYLKLIDGENPYIYINGISDEERKRCIRKIHKLIKNLKKGKTKVLNPGCKGFMFDPDDE